MDFLYFIKGHEKFFTKHNIMSYCLLHYWRTTEVYREKRIDILCQNVSNMSCKPNQHTLIFMSCKPNQHTLIFMSCKPNQHTLIFMSCKPNQHTRIFMSCKPNQHTLIFMSCKPNQHTLIFMSCKPNQHTLIFFMTNFQYYVKSIYTYILYDKFPTLCKINVNLYSA